MTSIADHAGALGGHVDPARTELLDRVGDDICLVLSGAVERGPADEHEPLGQSEVLKDPRGRIRRLRRCDGESEATCCQGVEHLGNSDEHGVLEQPDIVIPLAILLDRVVDLLLVHPEVLAESVGERWAEEGAHRGGIGLRDPHVVKGVLDAGGDAWCGIGESSVKIEEDDTSHGATIAHQREEPYAAAVADSSAGSIPASIEVIAHRGASAEEPEHTLAAYLAAVEQGADGVECDVRLTKDGVLVCHHDRRIDRTSTGRGVVSAMRFDELKRHDFDQGEVPLGLPKEPERTNLLTLRTLLTTLLDASSTVRFSIETKHPNRYGRDLERELLAMLREFDLLVDDPAQSRVRLMSFSRYAARWMAREAPAHDTVYLMDPVRRRWRDGSLPTGVRIAGPSIETLKNHPGYVAKVHARGGAVHVWTVDEDADIELCVRLGVDAIISNRPGKARSIVASGH